jgi:hypothetical protein
VVLADEASQHHQYKTSLVWRISPKPHHLVSPITQESARFHVNQLLTTKTPSLPVQ